MHVYVSICMCMCVYACVCNVYQGRRKEVLSGAAQRLELYELCNRPKFCCHYNYILLCGMYVR